MQARNPQFTAYIFQIFIVFPLVISLRCLSLDKAKYHDPDCNLAPVDKLQTAIKSNPVITQHCPGYCPAFQ